ncbi:MAG TPA: hypothetical protein VGQ26_28030 [Streptosporangiaceae bacterium]|nr:hypothetical protein [Streptosporangiaceae bacterium]
MDSLVLQTAIGLVFIFGATAAAVSAVTEGVSRFLGLRAEYLLRGVRTLVDGQSEFGLSWRAVMPKMLGGRLQPAAADPPTARVAQIMSHPLVASSAKQADPPQQAGNTKLTSAQRRRLPSYIAGPTFARALLDILPRHPDRPGAPDHDGGPGDNRQGGRGRPARPATPDPLAAIHGWADADASSDPLAKALRPLLTGAQDNMQAFEASVARWYDDHMARVSGWYKRHVRWISLSAGLVLVILFNLDAIRIADSLYSDQAVRASVVTQATRAASCADKPPATCLADLQAKIGLFRLGGLPVGWAAVPVCAQRSCSWLDRRGLTNPGKSGINSVGAVLLVLLGWGLMVAALIPGARFWFDLLSRLGTLRSTGPRPSA